VFGNSKNQVAIMYDTLFCHLNFGIWNSNSFLGRSIHVFEFSTNYAALENIRGIWNKCCFVNRNEKLGYIASVSNPYVVRLLAPRISLDGVRTDIQESLSH
jgi:hypothetical protein